MDDLLFQNMFTLYDNATNRIYKAIFDGFHVFDALDATPYMRGDKKKTWAQYMEYMAWATDELEKGTYDSKKTLKRANRIINNVLLAYNGESIRSNILMATKKPLPSNAAILWIYFDPAFENVKRCYFLFKNGLNTRTFLLFLQDIVRKEIESRPEGLTEEEITAIIDRIRQTKRRLLGEQTERQEKSSQEKTGQSPSQRTQQRKASSKPAQQKETSPPPERKVRIEIRDAGGTKRVIQQEDLRQILAKKSLAEQVFDPALADTYMYMLDRFFRSDAKNKTLSEFNKYLVRHNVPPLGAQGDRFRRLVQLLSPPKTQQEAAPRVQEKKKQEPQVEKPKAPQKKKEEQEEESTQQRKKTDKKKQRQRPKEQQAHQATGETDYQTLINVPIDFDTWIRRFRKHTKVYTRLKYLKLLLKVVADDKWSIYQVPHDGLSLFNCAQGFNNRPFFSLPSDIASLRSDTLDALREFIGKRGRFTYVLSANVSMTNDELQQRMKTYLDHPSTSRFGWEDKDGVHRYIEKISDESVKKFRAHLETVKYYQFRPNLTITLPRSASETALSDFIQGEIFPEMTHTPAQLAPLLPFSPFSLNTLFVSFHKIKVESAHAKKELLKSSNIFYNKSIDTDKSAVILWFYQRFYYLLPEKGDIGKFLRSNTE